MSSKSALERTVSKVLLQTEADLIAQIDSAYHESLTTLKSSRTKIEQDYEKVVEGARKQADNLKRQIIGSSRLAARNKQLVLIEAAVNDVFEKAKSKLSTSTKEEIYTALMSKLLEDGLSAIGKDEVVVECNKNDIELLRKLIGSTPKKGKKTKVVQLEKPIDVIGGIRIRSADGSLIYDGTLDSRIERLKPLIRKSVVQMLRGKG